MAEAASRNLSGGQARSGGTSSGGTLVSAVSADLRRLILDGGIQPGEKLPSEAGLTKKYKVSRTVVREAVAAHDGETKVLIKGDARLSFGEVRRAMLAVESAGSADVGLVAERHDADGTGG